MRKIFSLFLVVLLLLTFVSCSNDVMDKIAETLGKTGENLFVKNNIIAVDNASAAAATTNSATGAVDKESGALVKEDQKATFMADILSSIDTASSSPEKQAALIEEMQKPVDDETKAIMETKVSEVNTALTGLGITVDIELPENPTNADLVALQVVNIVADQIIEKTSSLGSGDELSAEDKAAIVASALDAVTVLNTTTSAGGVDILGIALSTIGSDVSSILGGKGVLDDVTAEDLASTLKGFAPYSQLLYSVFDQFFSSTKKADGSYNIKETLVILKAKRAMYEAATCAAAYDVDFDAILTDAASKTEAERPTYILGRIKEEIGKELDLSSYSLGSLLDYVLCVVMTEFDNVMPAKLEDIITEDFMAVLKTYSENPGEESAEEILANSDYKAVVESLFSAFIGPEGDNYKTIVPNLVGLLSNAATMKTLGVFGAVVNIEFILSFLM